MKIEARIFEILTVFFWVVGIVYTVTTYYYWSGVEWAGVMALFFTGGLALITGTYLRFVARRVEIRPEDYEDAEIEDGAGDLGFFSPHSWWPILIGLGAATFAVGFAMSQWWFAGGAVIVILCAAAGLVFEYHTGPEKH